MVYCQNLADIIGSLGRPIVFAERCKVLQIIYNHIQNKDRIHSRTAVSDYEETEDDITITTEDGKSYQGSILVGADGIHSHIRKVMAEKLCSTNPAVAQDLLEGTFVFFKGHSKSEHEIHRLHK